MSYSYPLAFPTGVRGLQQLVITPNSVTAVSESPFTMSQQVQVFPGMRWQLDAKLAPLKRNDAEVWQAFFLRLNGRKGTFLCGDPLGTTPRGSAGGTPVVNGGSQVAGSTALNIRGLPNSITGVYKQGDWFHMVVGSNQRLHKILTDTNSDSSGHATLDIWPYLRETPADATALITSSAQGRFRLSTPAMAIQEDVGGIYTMAFGALEDL